MTRRRVFAVSAVILSLALGLLASEVVLRALGRRPHVAIVAPTPNAALWIRDRRLGWRNRPSVPFRYILAGSTITTGPEGERLGVGWTKDRSTPLVLFVGDSTTFCAEVDDDSTGPSEVAKRLPASLGVGVVNAGVRGYNTLQAARLAEEWLARAPVKLVVYTYCDNDYFENLVPRTNAPATAPAARCHTDGSLYTVEVPDSWGPEGAPVGDDLPPAALSWSSAFFRAAEARSVLATELGEIFERRPGARGYLERQAFSIRFAEERFGSRVLELLLGELRGACEAKGARLLVTRFATCADPARAAGALLDTQEKIVAACQAAGVQFFDVRPAFTLDERAYLAPLTDGTFDGHYGALGTATYGRALAPSVVRALEGKP
jgi:hypothetical protein